MSFYRIQHKQPGFDDQGLDAIDEWMRWTLVNEVAGELPSPRVWQNIQAKIAAPLQAAPRQSRAKELWRNLASLLQAYVLGFIAPPDTDLDSRLALKERSYLLWRESLLLSLMPMTVMVVC